MDPRLTAESFPLGELSLCEVLLYDDSRFPWLVLVPQKENLVEIVDLGDHERIALMDDITDACRALKEITNCHKLNVAALGNVVPQLHVHVIARSRRDPAWPRPVWGHAAAVPYTDKAAGEVLSRLRRRLWLTDDKR